jgi:broad specificity phosphatase PhoE
MKIGLVRHFKVNFPPQKMLMNSEDFKRSMEDYDSSPVETKKINLNPDEWDICYSSTMPRAITTAKAIYQGEIIITDDIREVQMYPCYESYIKYPSVYWRILARIAFYMSHPSQYENINDTKRRIENFYNTLLSCKEENILVVTHGFFMRLMAERLIKEGFKGKYDPIPKNGMHYIFTK